MAPVITRTTLGVVSTKAPVSGRTLDALLTIEDKQRKPLVFIDSWTG
jgi:hypothetical protein